jgi:hypothetical protein
MDTRKRVLLVALAGIWIGWLGQSPVRAITNPWLCENACTGAAECNTECWLTQFEFDQDYPSTTCEEEDYECCGDGVCNPSAEGCNACTDDCGEVPTCPPTRECYDHDDCDSGEVCNAAGECIPYSPEITEPPPFTCGGSCTSNSDCCGIDVCLGATGGSKYCGVPSQTSCPNAPPCWGWWNGEAYNSCEALGEKLACSSGPKAMYCDPGINRCMFNQGFDCPYATEQGNNICTV